MYNGCVLVDKPEGFTSFDVVAKLRGIFGTKKIGHTGTLDPMATGVLCVCIGKATKAVEYLSAHDKTYRAGLLLGLATDTGDVTGETTCRIPQDELNISDDKIHRIFKSFKGTYEQLPPMYSAKKVNGKKLCDLARMNKTVDRKFVPVTIYDISIESIELPQIYFFASVSSGTYIRTLCEDIAKSLGVPGTMKSLRRTELGRFNIDDCFTLDNLQMMKDKGTLDKALLPVDDVLSKSEPGWKKLVLPKKLDFSAKNGAKLPLDEIAFELFSPTESDDFLVYSSCGEFIGIHKICDGMLCPRKMFCTNEA